MGHQGLVCWVGTWRARHTVPPPRPPPLQSNDWCDDPWLKRLIREVWKVVQTAPALAAFSRDLHRAAPWLKIGPFAGVREAAFMMTLEHKQDAHPDLWRFFPEWMGGGGVAMDRRAFPAAFLAFFAAERDAILVRLASTPSLAMLV